jgi:predicted transposase YbfD/YdcC
MKHSTIGLEVPKADEGYAFDFGSLYCAFEELADTRKDRGKRYALALVLVLIVLAKLCGEDQPYGIAQWARERAEQLARLLGLSRPKLPSHNTYRRILRDIVPVDELQAVVRRFLLRVCETTDAWLVSVDGKTLRGSVPIGQDKAVHLLAAYLPQARVVLMQVAVDGKENEIRAAPRLLQSLDLRGKVVMGDAMLTQRKLSEQIVVASGEYVWLVKENQPQLRREIAELFEPQACPAASSTPPDDFRCAHTLNKGHGRLEERRLTTSGLLNNYLTWPHVRQVFKLEHHATILKDNTQREEVVYGLTSLTPAEASAERLLGITRDYWGIENGLHYRRDKTLHEDGTRMTDSPLSEAMATLNNLLVGLMAWQGWPFLPAARRYCSAHIEDTLTLLLRCPA